MFRSRPNLDSSLASACNNSAEVSAPTPPRPLLNRIMTWDVRSPVDHVAPQPRYTQLGPACFFSSHPCRSPPPDAISRCSAESRGAFFSPKSFTFFQSFPPSQLVVKITVCCGVGGPMIVTTQRSVSATLFLCLDQTAARKSPPPPFMGILWIFFFHHYYFLLSLHLLLPAPACLQGLVLRRRQLGLKPNIRPLSRLCVAAPLLSCENVDSQSQFQARSVDFPGSFGWI